MIRYQITSLDPTSHYFDVSIRIDQTDPAGHALRLPNWIPGSYMIRDFARNLIELRARDETGELEIEQIDKSNWCVAACSGALTITYKVYAKDLSVRAAHLDDTHGYYNGSSVFLEVLGQSEQACEVQIERPSPDYCAAWRVATSLKRKQAEAFGFGLYEALDYDDLIDHPVEMGEFVHLGFEACGVPHDVVLTGRFECDGERLVADLKKICEQHIRFFGEPAPMEYYLFQVMVVGDGYGGLEHRASTSLVTSRASLPKPGQGEVDDDYRDFLGLCSHEYFHSWNVKRIKPEVYRPYNLQHEVYTDLLWAFEGITSYYDDLALVRTGLIDTQSYLELLAQTMTRVQRGLGRKRQSAAESSYNAWTKFYKQDENAANSIVSYYAKGCLIAACIDLKMREISAGAKSLDDVMRSLWREYLEQGRGVEPERIQQLVSEISGEDLGEFLKTAIYGTGDLPLVELLDSVGVDVIQRPAANLQDKGGKDANGGLPRVDFGAMLKAENGNLVIQRVIEAGSAQSSGLAAGDQIVAVDGLRLDLAQFEKKVLRADPGDFWYLHAFRRDELRLFEVEFQAAEANTIVLKTGGSHQSARGAWLNAE
jgi:predicted metalloprotease with PDZ domain